MANETNIGWVRLYRSTLGWEWFCDPLALQLWVVCLLKANHAPTRWQGIEIERGSFVASVDKLCAATGQTARQIRTRLSHLQTSGELTIKTTNKYSIITVCKYDVYQPIADDSDKQNDNQPTNDRQTTDNQTTTNNNNKELNNYKESLSFACTHATTAEKESFFKIFFFKNFINPDYEVERFCANYEASGWIRKNGQVATDRPALARTWTQEDKNAAPRFNADFLAKYRRFYGLAKQTNPALAPIFIHDLELVFIDAERKRLTFRCTRQMVEAVEANIRFFRDNFFDKHFAGWTLHYQTPRT